MRKNVFSVLLIATLALLLAVPVVAGPGGQKPPAPSGRGRPTVKTVVSVEGVITAINEGRSSFTMRVLTPGHQRIVGSDTMTVQVQSGTDIHIGRKGGGPALERSASVRDFRVGDRVHVEALRLDNGQFLAVRVVVQNRQVEESEEEARARTASRGQEVQIQGIVTGKGDRSLTVRQDSGKIRTVLVTSSTDITGRVTTFRAIKINDLVSVGGTVNADGSITARRIKVLVAGAAGNETTVTGTIVVKNSTAARFLLLSSGTAVSVSDSTRITSGGQTRSFDDLRIGMTITVTGSPITVAGLTVGINARVINF
jgi:hypothetical protein